MQQKDQLMLDLKEYLLLRWNWQIKQKYSILHLAVVQCRCNHHGSNNNLQDNFCSLRNEKIKNKIPNCDTSLLGRCLGPHLLQLKKY
jgi:hypothetical protein